MAQIQLLEEKEEFSIKPVTITDVLLLSPGRWNGTDYTLEELVKAFSFTNWNDRKFTSLYLDHQDTKERGVGNWAGYVKNPRLVNNELRGDLEVWNPMIGVFLKQAKAKFGVSATLAGREVSIEKEEGVTKMEDFHFESFSIVTDPACKPAWINLENKEKTENLKVVTMDNEIADNHNSEKIEVSKELVSSTEPAKASDVKDLKGGFKEMPNLKSENESKKLAEEEVKEEEKVEEKVEEQGEEEVKEAAEEQSEAQPETPSETPSEAETQPSEEPVETETSSDELQKDSKKSDEDEDDDEDEDEEDDKEELLADDAILNKVKEMDAKELAEYTSFAKEHLSKIPKATASEITQAYLKCKKIEEKKLSGDALLEALDSRIADLKELDSSKEIATLKSQVKELQEKTQMPDRKTLSVGFDGMSSQDANLGMLGFLSKRLN